MRLPRPACINQMLNGIFGRTLRQTQIIPTWLAIASDDIPSAASRGLYPVRSFRQSSVTFLSGTIFALSSGHGKCGVAVIRVSGSRSKDAVQLMTRKEQLPPPRMAVLRRLYDVETREPIDRGLLLWFPGPDSFTGEDCCEFHVHGGRAVVEAVFKSLSHIEGLRHAEAGEFTKRAFEHGKLDLTEVEGLADLIHAETEAQRRQALRQMEGALSKLYAEWRRKLLKSCANVEAFIDFSEEENIEDGVIEQVEKDVKQVIDQMEHHLNDNRRGERLRNGIHVAIIGQPNVGKSSLLNFLCQRPAAIVSPIPGTTRDVVETALNLGGYPVLISDTAGLRETQDAVEREGVKRAISRAKNADIKIIVADLTQTSCSLFTDQATGGSTRKESLLHKPLMKFFFTHLKELGLLNKGHADDLLYQMSDRAKMDFGDYPVCINECILLFNKLDLLSHDKKHGKSIYGESSGLAWCCVSCLTEEGLDHFLDVLQAKVKEMCYNPDTSNPSLTQARHREHLNHCVEALHSYLTLQHKDVVLAARQLQVALRHIGKITGKITSEEILDVIFRDFCIGK